jgi:ribosomal protein S18 acetylase RimI-like enzyme
MFPAEAREFLESSARDGLTSESGAVWWVFEVDGIVQGVVFAQEREATDRVWDVTMLAVAPDSHGTGLGSRLLAHLEAALRARGQRLLVIETSSLPAYERTRRFYARCGYREVARVPDYFEDGDDMVLFWKRLDGGP